MKKSTWFLAYVVIIAVIASLAVFGSMEAMSNGIQLSPEVVKCGQTSGPKTIYGYCRTDSLHTEDIVKFKDDSGLGGYDRVVLFSQSGTCPRVGSIEFKNFQDKCTQSLKEIRMKDIASCKSQADSNCATVGAPRAKSQISCSTFRESCGEGFPSDTCTKGDPVEVMCGLSYSVTNDGSPTDGMKAITLAPKGNIIHNRDDNRYATDCACLYKPGAAVSSKGTAKIPCQGCGSQ